MAAIRSEKIISPFTGKETEFKCRSFDFDAATVIPVLIVYITCNYSFEVFGGRTIDKGPSVLFLRRGFGVGAMPGLWSVVAGVDDIIGEVGNDQDPVPFEMMAEYQRVRVMDEIRDETGIPYEDVIKLTCIGERDQVDLDKPNRVFRQTLYWAEVNPVKRIAINYEHTGAIFVPMGVIDQYFKLGTTDKELLTIIKDGIVPGFGEGLKFLCDRFYQKYPPAAV